MSDYVDTTDYIKDPTKKLNYLNGVKNTKKNYEESMIYLGKLTNIHMEGVHAASFGLLHDLFEYFNTTFNHASYEQSRLIQEKWYRDFKGFTSRWKDFADLP